MNKQLVALLAVVMLTGGTLAGCGETNTQSSPQTAQDSSSAATVEESASEPEEKSEYYFKDGVMQAKDIKIEILDYKVIQKGEKGNEYGNKPVIAFWYNTTNITGEEINPSMAWIAMFDAIQDNNPNAINRLEISSLPDGKFSNTQIETIKKGGTVENAVAYQLDDLTTPVTLRANRGIGGEELGSQTFEIK